MVFIAASAVTRSGGSVQRLPGALALACSAGLAGQRLAGRAEPPGPWETGFGAVRLHLARARPLVVGMKTMVTPRTASAPW